MLRCPYKHPGFRTYVPSPDEVRMRAMPARTTLEFALALAVGFLAVLALRTGPASVPGINRDHRHAGQPGFVLDKATQLEESPTREPITLFAAPSRYPIADACQVFKANPTP